MKHPAVLIRRRALFGIAAALIVLAAATAFSMRWKGAEAGDGGLPGPEAAMEDDFGNSFARLSSTGVDAAKNGGFTLTLETEPGSLGLVTLYGGDGEKRLEWRCNTGLPYAVELAEDRFWVLLETETGGQLRCLGTEDGRELWRRESAEGFCDLGLLEDGTLCVIGLESALVLDAQGEAVYEYEYGSQPLSWGFAEDAGVVDCAQGRVVLYAERAEVYNED